MAKYGKRKGNAKTVPARKKKRKTQRVFRVGGYMA